MKKKRLKIKAPEKPLSLVKFDPDEFKPIDFDKIFEPAFKAMSQYFEQESKSKKWHGIFKIMHGE
jgi:hypothetical protein